MTRKEKACLTVIFKLSSPQPLPELSRIPGVVLSGAAFAHCLTVVEFLHGYGKVIGLNIPKDIPSLATLQEGLLGLGEGQAEVQDLVLKLLEAALHDPGLSSYYQVCGTERKSVSQSVGQLRRVHTAFVRRRISLSFHGALSLCIVGPSVLGLPRKSPL